MIDIHSFVGLFIYLESLTIHRLVVQVVGVLSGKVGHLCHSLFLLALTVVEGTLGQGDPLVLAVVLLHLIQHTDSIVVVLHLLVELEKHLQHLLLTLVTVVDSLDHRDSAGIVLLADIGLGKSLHIGGVLRGEFRSLLYTGHRLVLLF